MDKPKTRTRADELPQEVQEEARRITGIILNECIMLHKKYGPYMMEVFYKKMLAARLIAQGLWVDQEVPIDVVEDGVAVKGAFRMDLVVNKMVIIELKATPIAMETHEVQLYTYLRLSRLHYGVLVNFGLERLIDGFKRIAF